VNGVATTEEISASTWFEFEQIADRFCMGTAEHEGRVMEVTGVLKSFDAPLTIPGSKPSTLKFTLAKERRASQSKPKRGSKS